MKRTSTSQLLFTFVPSSLILAAVAAAALLIGVNMPDMTKDVAAIAKIHPLAGVLSSLGILLWCATASICLFAAMSLRNSARDDGFRFLLFSALLSAYLLCDDLFQIHETLAPRYLGLSEKAVYAALGTAAAAYFIAFRWVILRTHYGILLLALSFLAGSVLIDTLLEPYLWRLGQWAYFFEDGAKWLGIASWCSYFSHTSQRLLGLHVPDLLREGLPTSRS